jgi:signal transduction histidine kinase
MSAVGTLTSGIAHELNNPLNNISITAEALIEGFDDYNAEQRMKMLRDIYSQTERASETVRSLLDFTRIDNARMESVDVAALVESTLKLVRNELTLHQVESSVDLPDDLPRVRGYLRNLQQVILNLFLNAVQAMPQGGRLRVAAAVDDGFVRVDVEDDGCGIAPENLDRVFDPFFTTKEVGQGTGLGLSVSYGIVRKVGGRIEVESEPGKGTTFSVYLKVEDDAD